MTDLYDLAMRLTMFVKDFDYYDYMDSLEIDQTDDQDRSDEQRDYLRMVIYGIDKFIRRYVILVHLLGKCICYLDEC